ncbi:EF-hand calcium-binding domain-containing protein 6 [Rhinoraja longicauda]
MSAMVGMRMSAMVGMSRPPSHASVRLQHIPHPLSRLGEPDTITVRGFSRAGAGDKPDTEPRQGQGSRRGCQDLLQHIPEGVEVTFGTDPGRPRLPVFGQRTDLESRPESGLSKGSRISNRSRPGTQLRIEIDELEHLLREKVISSGYFAVKQLFKSNDPEGREQLNREVLLMVLSKFLGRFITPKQFHQLLLRYDTDGLGVIKEDVLMRKLGADYRSRMRHNNEGSAQRSYDQISFEDSRIFSPALTRTLSKAELERKASLDIEKWLKDKFREGYNLMKEAFEKYDPERTCKVLHRDFLSVLGTFGLHLRTEHLNLFLLRCNLENTRAGIKYIDFLKNFQDRSEKGLPHKILNNPKHKFNNDGSDSFCSTMTAIEAKLTRLFQSDFLALLATFHKIDKLEMNIISQQEFRAAIESRFGVEITDEEFELLIDRIPLDEDGNIRYPQFMALFDSRKGVSSLFDEKSVILPGQKGQQEKQISSELDEDRRYGRTTEQLFKIIKALLYKQYQEVEREFEQLDEINSKRLNQETMYRLLKSFDICPEVTRGEIRRLWKTLITNQEKTLDFLEFVRHFGHSPKSACFPNAKISPPKKGDCDLRMRSKNLNCASDILVDSVRAKVDYLWDDLRKEFQELDPYRTGFTSREEFKDILSELCINLNEYECEMLAKKFGVNGDGRVSYIDFLRPLAMRRHQWREGSNMMAVLQHPNSQFTAQHGTGLDTITDRLRQKLQGEWKPLRRAFKKLDSTSSGYLSLPEFRAVLKLCDLLLNEDEVYHVMTKFDENMEGKVNYKKFLEETYKKENRAESKIVK